MGGMMFCVPRWWDGSGLRTDLTFAIRSRRKTRRAILYVFGADAVEWERRHLLRVEIELAEIDTPHPPVVHGPVVIDLMARVGDDGPLRIAKDGVIFGLALTHQAPGDVEVVEHG